MIDYPGILAAVGDLHTNSFSGLAPPIIYSTKGNPIQQNPFQVWLWDKWLRYWDYMGEIKTRTKLPLVLVLNGDSVDKNKYAHDELMSLSDTVIQAMAIDAVQPAVDVADIVYVVRGTPAHTGQGSWYEDALGKAIGAVSPNPAAFGEYKQHSWWHLYLELGGVTFDIHHRPESSSMRPWTRGAGAMRIAKIVMDEYIQSGDRPPDIALRNHFHHWEDSGTNQPTRAFMLPAWQGATDFTHYIGMGSKIHPVGGVYFTCRDGKYSPWEQVVYSPKRRKAEKALG